MTDDDRKALGPEGVAVAEALGLVWRCATCGASEPVEPTGGADDAYEVGDKEPCTTCETGTARVEAELPGDQCAFDHEPETYGEWLTAVDRWSWTTDGRAPPLCPLDALYAAVAGPYAYTLDEAPTYALIAELRRTREERDAARQERDAARANADPHADDRDALCDGADDVDLDGRRAALAEWLGLGPAPADVDEWQYAVCDWHCGDCAAPPPPCPLDNLLPYMMRPGCTASEEAPVHGLAVELRAARQELAAARAARDAALDALAGMVRQFCGPVGDETCEINARGYRANAEAIEVLADAGRIVIECGDGGRTVYGRWVR